MDKKEVFFMRLWTIQDERGYNQLKENKVFSGNIEYVDYDFKRSYRWMVGQMEKRLKTPRVDLSTYPVWAWYQWNGTNKRKPDLRYTAHLPKGEKGYRVEFEIEEEAVLLSDFDLFHHVINYWYQPKGEKDDKLFELEMEKKQIELFTLQDFNKHSRVIDDLRLRIEKSWDLIFDLEWYDKYINYPKDKKSIQATFWELRWEQVIDVKGFIGR
jgi:hypothetical protein